MNYKTISYKTATSGGCKFPDKCLCVPGLGQKGKAIKKYEYQTINT